MFNTAVESYEHVDYTGLKDESSRAKITKNIDPSALKGSPLCTLIFYYAMRTIRKLAKLQFSVKKVILISIRNTATMA